MYKSRKRRKRTPYKNKPYRKPRSTNSYLSSARNLPERKALDISTVAFTPTTAGAFLLLNGCTRGATIEQRTGRKITMNYCQLHIRPLTNTTPTLTGVRIMLVYDRQTNGTSPTIGILEAANSGSALGLNSRDRYRVLWDRYFSYKAISGATYSLNMNDVVFKPYIPLSHTVTFTDGNEGTVADIATGSLVLVGVSDLAAGDTAPIFSVYSRVRFTDN